ncbi:unnamed protein product [Mytilus edulis]|uniref:Uncharacterized protein n=1 Tax=Mytilus edulis TaxID=6550 RepID=A0A8S3U9D7_MYTED|nr:unnamed protein product [Mytilus edulis]
MNLNSLYNISKNIGPYLEGISPFFDIVMAFVQVDSDILAFMKDMMKNIDHRLDQIDNRFNDIERLIKWNVVQINFGQIEQRMQRHGSVTLPIVVELRQFNEKYYWRTGLLSRRTLHGADKHFAMVREGHINYRKHGRNLIEASVDKSPFMMIIQSEAGNET